MCGCWERQSSLQSYDWTHSSHCPAASQQHRTIHTLTILPFNIITPASSINHPATSILQVIKSILYALEQSLPPWKTKKYQISAPALTSHLIRFVFFFNLTLNDSRGFLTCPSPAHSGIFSTRQSGVYWAWEWGDRVTNQTLGHYIPVTGNHDTNNNDGSFRSYFLQIPGTFEHFQARSLSFEMFHFRILTFEMWCENGEERRVQWLLIVPTLTLLQLSVGVGGGGGGREQQKNREGWMEVGWRMEWSGQLDYHRQQSNSRSKLYSTSIVAIFQEQSAPDRESWHFLSFNLVSAGCYTGQDLSDCDNKKQINIRHNVSSLNVTAGGEILVSQSVFQ